MHTAVNAARCSTQSVFAGEMWLIHDCQGTTDREYAKEGTDLPTVGSYSVLQPKLRTTLPAETTTFQEACSSWAEALRLVLVLARQLV